MQYCFVIQPFDHDKYDKRYNDIFEPAIKICGFEPYRVDKDPSVSIPIDTIEDKIKNSSICFAEISTDNPNVWFELGYALAYNKEIILVCSKDERITPFPFDVRHRNIINYSTGSITDYQKLSKQIEDRIKAILPKLQIASNHDIQSKNTTTNLSKLEIDTLCSILSLQPVDEDYAIIYDIQELMNKKSYSNTAVNLAIRKLKSKKFISSKVESDYNNNEFIVLQLSTEGENWLINNENLLDLKQDCISLSDESAATNDNEVPF